MGLQQYLLPGLVEGINNRVCIKCRARWGCLYGVMAMKCPGKIPIHREPTSTSWMPVPVTFTFRISGRGQRNILTTPLQCYLPMSWISDCLYTSSAWPSLPRSSCSILRVTALLIISKSPALLPPASQTWWVSSLRLSTPPSSPTPSQYSLLLSTSPMHCWNIVIAPQVLVGCMIAMKLFRVNLNCEGGAGGELRLSYGSPNSHSIPSPYLPNPRKRLREKSQQHRNSSEHVVPLEFYNMDFILLLLDRIILSPYAAGLVFCTRLCIHPSQRLCRVEEKWV